MTLRLIIDGEPDLTVVAEAADGDAAIALVDDHRPEVVLMDVRMPRRDGLSATREILSRSAPPHVLMLTTFDLRRPGAGRTARRSPRLHPQRHRTRRHHRSGAHRRRRQPGPVPQATARVIAVATGPQFSDTRTAAREAARKQLSTLTDRELEPARAIADGLGNPEIAQRLHISIATVKAHTGNLFAKLAVENRVQIALLVRDAEE